MGNSWVSIKNYLLSIVGLREVYQVDGDSMEPMFYHGDYLYASNNLKRKPPKIGDVVVAKHPYQQGVLIVKKVKNVDGSYYYLEGLNKLSSTDSRSFGSIPISRLIGKVVAKK